MDGIMFLDSIIQMPLMSLPVRSTFVQLDRAGILISPGSRLEKEQLKKLNSVTDIVAPNLLHCAGIKPAAEVHSQAKIWAPVRGMQAKPEINWSKELSKDQWPYQDQLALILLEGMPKLNEALFIHKKSKSLIVTDLCFNLVDSKGIGAWIILHLFGTYRKFGVSKFMMRYAEDKALVKKSLAEIFSYDFDNIILSHGSNVIGEAKNKLLKALQERELAPN